MVAKKQWIHGSRKGTCVGLRPAPVAALLVPFLWQAVFMTSVPPRKPSLSSLVTDIYCPRRAPARSGVQCIHEDDGIDGAIRVGDEVGTQDFGGRVICARMSQEDGTTAATAEILHASMCSCFPAREWPASPISCMTVAPFTTCTLPAFFACAEDTCATETCRGCIAAEVEKPPETAVHEAWTMYGEGAGESEHEGKNTTRITAVSKGAKRRVGDRLLG